MPFPASIGIIWVSYFFMLFGLVFTIWGLGLLEWLTMKAADPRYFCTIFNCTHLFPDQDQSKFKPVQYWQAGLVLARALTFTGLSANVMAWLCASLYLLRLGCTARKSSLLARLTGFLSMFGISFISIGLLFYATSIRYFQVTVFNYMHNYLKLRLAYTMCIMGSVATALGGILIWLEGLKLISSTFQPMQGKVLHPAPYSSQPIYHYQVLPYPMGGQQDLRGASPPLWQSGAVTPPMAQMQPMMVGMPSMWSSEYTPFHQGHPTHFATTTV